MIRPHPNITLRPARMEDCSNILQWRNQKLSIVASTSGKEISWDEHKKWFDHALTDKDNHLIYIIETDNTKNMPIGSVRFERKAPHWCVVSINIVEEFTGQGIGARALQRGFSLCRGEWSDCSVHAFIRKDNRASYSAFKKAGCKKIEGGVDCPYDHIEIIAP